MISEKGCAKGEDAPCSATLRFGGSHLYPDFLTRLCSSGIALTGRVSPLLIRLQGLEAGQKERGVPLPSSSRRAERARRAGFTRERYRASEGGARAYKTRANPKGRGRR